MRARARGQGRALQTLFHWADFHVPSVTVLFEEDETPFHLLLRHCIRGESPIHDAPERLTTHKFDLIVMMAAWLERYFQDTQTLKGPNYSKVTISVNGLCSIV